MIDSTETDSVETLRAQLADREKTIASQATTIEFMTSEFDRAAERINEQQHKAAVHERYIRELHTRLELATKGSAARRQAPKGRRRAARK